MRQFMRNISQYSKQRFYLSPILIELPVISDSYSYIRFIKVGIGTKKRSRSGSTINTPQLNIVFKIDRYPNRKDVLISQPCGKTLTLLL